MIARNTLGAITMGITWSLAIEEQFYLIWPWIIKKTGRLLLVFSALIIFYLLVKIFLKLNGNESLYACWYFFRLDCMAAGGIGALLVFQRKKAVLAFFCNKASWLLCIATCFFSLYKVIPVPFFREEFYAFIFLVLLINVGTTQDRASWLENKLLNFLGQISYGIYIYHPLVIYLAAAFFKRFVSHQLLEDSRYATVYASIIAGTIATAWFSYRFIEAPLLRRKEYFSKL